MEMPVIERIFDPRTLEVQEDLGFEASSQFKASLSYTERPNTWAWTQWYSAFASNEQRLTFESEFF